MKACPPCLGRNCNQGRECDRFPRTLTEAFGPGPHRLEEPAERPFDREDLLVMAACAVAFVWALLLSVAT